MGFQVPGAGSLETAVPSRPVGVDHVFLQVHLLPAGETSGRDSPLQGAGNSAPAESAAGPLPETGPVHRRKPVPPPSAGEGRGPASGPWCPRHSGGGGSGRWGMPLSGHDPLDLKGHCLRLRLGRGGHGDGSGRRCGLGESPSEQLSGRTPPCRRETVPDLKSPENRSPPGQRETPAPRLGPPCGPLPQRGRGASGQNCPAGRSSGRSRPAQRALCSQPSFRSQCAARSPQTRGWAVQCALIHWTASLSGDKWAALSRSLVSRARVTGRASCFRPGARRARIGTRDPAGQQAAQGRFPPVHGIVSLRLIESVLDCVHSIRRKFFQKRNGFWKNCGNIMK